MITFNVHLSLTVLTSQIQDEGRRLNVLWRDRSTGVVSGMLRVETVDSHPLLIGAQVQSVSAGTASGLTWRFSGRFANVAVCIFK